jgi:hypothetical protein
MIGNTQRAAGFTRAKRSLRAKQGLNIRTSSRATCMWSSTVRVAFPSSQPTRHIGAIEFCCRCKHAAPDTAALQYPTCIFLIYRKMRLQSSLPSRESYVSY